MIRLYTCTRIRARHHLTDDRVYAFTALGVYAYHGTPLCHEENAVFDAYHVSVFTLIRVHCLRGIRGDGYTLTNALHGKHSVIIVAD